MRAPLSSMPLKSSNLKLLYCILFIITAQVTANAQGFIDFSKLVPPSPEATSLLKATKVPVDHSTGVASIAILLYEVRTGSVSIPISLNYHASGIKVDQLSSSVGLGWGLSAGGAVQRTVRGQPDDGPSGSFELNINDSYINDMNEDMTVNDNDYLLSGRDFTQDDYSYNFLGFSNSFYFDFTQTLYQVLKEPVKLERLQYLEPLPYFQARDFNGNLYEFKQADWSGMRNWATNSPMSQDIYRIANSWLNGQLVTQTPVKIVGPWRYYEIILANVSAVNIAGDNIDEVRLYPANAQMITYTYEPLVGMTSQCDAANRITYYEYDGSGRLSLIRDENKNILKRFCYRYQGQPIPCGLPTDPVWEFVSSSCEQNGQNLNTGNTIVVEKDINPASNLEMYLSLLME